MWVKPRLSVQPLALLLWAFVWFFDRQGLFAALLPAVLIHELGHYLFLRFGGLRLRRLHLGLSGLEMDHFGSLEGVHGFLTILAGPFFGLAWALIAGFIPGQYWRMTSGASLCLSAVNLLPVLPLDGGRMLVLLSGERGALLSRVFALALLFVGVYMLFAYHMLGPLVFAASILHINRKDYLKRRKKLNIARLFTICH